MKQIALSALIGAIVSYVVATVVSMQYEQERLDRIYLGK